MSVRALAIEQGRDYKNVHRDVQQLERIGLIGRTRDYKVEVPWDIVEARLNRDRGRCQTQKSIIHRPACQSLVRRAG